MAVESVAVVEVFGLEVVSEEEPDLLLLPVEVLAKQRLRQ